MESPVFVRSGTYDCIAVSSGLTLFAIGSRWTLAAPGETVLLRSRPFEAEPEQAGEGVVGGNVLGPAVGGGNGAVQRVMGGGKPELPPPPAASTSLGR